MLNSYTTFRSTAHLVGFYVILQLHCSSNDKSGVMYDTILVWIIGSCLMHKSAFFLAKEERKKWIRLNSLNNCGMLSLGNSWKLLFQYPFKL